MSDEKQPFNTMLTEVPALQLYDKAVQQFPIPPEQGRQMFSICIKNSIKQALEQDRDFMIKSHTDYVGWARKNIR